VVPPRGKCIWGCGRSNFNREHILGENTIATRLGLDFPVRIELGDSDSMTEVVLEDRVCAGCNGGFMRKSDEAMVAFMDRPIREGTRVELSRGRQEILGRWAVKIALLLQMWMHDLREVHPELDLVPCHVPADHFHRLRSGDPYKTTRVWIGAAQPEFSRIPLACMSMANPMPEPTPSGVELLVDRGYQTWFTLHTVVFLVVGWDEGHKYPVADDALDGAKQFPGKLQQVWPPSPERIEWPPQGRLSSQQIASLTKTYPDWVGPEQGPVPKSEQG
jgi:hypothetical protein